MLRYGAIDLARLLRNAWIPEICFGVVLATSGLHCEKASIRPLRDDVAAPLALLFRLGTFDFGGTWLEPNPAMERVCRVLRGIRRSAFEHTFRSLDTLCVPR